MRQLTGLSCADNVFNYEVDNRKGESNDDEADDAVKDSVFSLFNLASIAGGGHIGDAADDDDDNGNDTEDTDNGVQDVSNIRIKSISFVANLIWLYDFC